MVKPHHIFQISQQPAQLPQQTKLQQPPAKLLQLQQPAELPQWTKLQQPLAHLLQLQQPAQQYQQPVKNLVINYILYFNFLIHKYFLQKLKVYNQAKIF